jgi:isopentenyl phosphate kinase
LSNVEGVLDERGKVISEITKKDFLKIKKYLKGADKIDVTGGMIHKVKEALGMVEGKREIFILGFKKGNLERCLKGEKIGTKIS